MESRPIWLEAGCRLSARSQVCGRASRALECLVDADNAHKALVGPWQYQSEVWAGSTPPLVPTRYTTLPYPACPHTARPRHARLDHGWGTLGHCTYDTFGTPVGDPRGRIRTGVMRTRPVMRTRQVIEDQAGY